MKKGEGQEWINRILTTGEIMDVQVLAIRWNVYEFLHNSLLHILVNSHIDIGVEDNCEEHL